MKTLAFDRLDKDQMAGLKRPELAGNYAFFDEDHPDQPIICVGIPGISTHSEEVLRDHMVEILVMWNNGLPIILSDREIKEIVATAKNLASDDGLKKLDTLTDVEIIKLLTETSRARVLEVLMTTRIVS